MDIGAFKELRQPVFVFNGLIWYTIIANHGICQDQNLTAIRRVCQGFRVANHARIEDNFTRSGSVGAKRIAFNWMR